MATSFKKGGITKLLLAALIITASFSPFLGAPKTFAQVEPLQGEYYGPGGNPNDFFGPGGDPNNPATAESSPGSEAGKQTGTPKGPQFKGCTNLFNFGLAACVANVLTLWMWLIAWSLFLAGLLLDTSLYFTIHLSALMQSVPVVDIGWTIFRDIANVCFIFILLWIAISTILGLNSGKTKELLVHLIIMALLMNFSLFITKAVVDGSNIIAIHFYDLIVPNPTGSTLSKLNPAGSASFSGAFMEGLKIQSVYDNGASGNSGTGGGPGAAFGSILGDTFKSTLLDTLKVILISVFGSILMVVAAYVFVVAAILFVIRIVVLMFVMILSPLAFLAYILPSTEKYAEQWREKLISQSLFAPIYLSLAYVVVRTIQTPAFKQVMSLGAGVGAGGLFTSAGGILINFLLLIGLMVGCILVAKKMEAGGVEMAMGAGAKFTQSALRGKHVSMPFSALSYVSKEGGELLQKRNWTKNIGQKLYGFGDKLDKRTERARKALDVTEWEKGFRESTFGQTGLGSLIREQTLGKLVKAKFGGEESLHDVREEDKKRQQSQEEITKKKYAIQLQKSLNKVAEALKAFAKKPKVENFTDTAGTIDSAGFALAMQKYNETFGPKRTAYPAGAAGDVAFTEAQTVYDNSISLVPQRSSYTGPNADKDYARDLALHTEEYFEKPSASTFTNPANLVAAQKMVADRKKTQEDLEKSVKDMESQLGTAVGAISTQGFAELGEHDIHALAKYSTLAQVDAVLKSTEWTLDEKREMLGPKFESYVERFRERDKEVEAYERDRKKLEQLAVAGEIRLDGKDGSIIEDTTQKIIDGNVVVSGVVKCKVPVAPPMPSDLKGWARNDMTVHGYELLYALMPEALKSPSLISVVRHGFTHKELRFNNNLGFNDRNEISFTKDVKIRRFVDKKDPNYFAANTDTERQTAYTEALAAAQAVVRAIGAGATKEQKQEAWDNEWAKAKVKYLQKDIIVETAMREWASGRSADEIASARSLFRNSPELHFLVDKGIAPKWESKDSEDIVFLMRDLLRAYKAEVVDKNGVMTLANRKALEDILYNPRRNIQIPPLTAETELREGIDEWKDAAGNTVSDVRELEALLKQLRLKPQTSTSTLSSVVDNL